MREKFLCLMVLTAFLIPIRCFAGLRDHPVVAVLPYANKAAVSEQISLADASLVSEFVVEKLIDSECFGVVTRDDLLAVTQEQGLQASALIDPMTSVQMGKIAGARYLVVGSVTGLSTKESTLGYNNSVAGGFDANKMTVIANLTLRFIDAETGLVAMAVSGTGESASTNMEFTLNKAKNSSFETTEYDESTGEEYVMEGLEKKIVTHSIRIGSYEFSQVQVRNALYKAADNLVFDKNYGVLAKLGVKDPQKIKRRKV